MKGIKNTAQKNREKVLFLLVWLIRCLLVFCLFLFLDTFSFFSFFQKLFIALLPFLLGIFLALLLEPITRKLEKHLPRLVSCIIPFLVLAIILFLLCFILGPPLIKEGSHLLKQLPEILEDLKHVFAKWFPFTTFPSLKREVFQMLDQAPAIVERVFGTMFPEVCSSCLGILSSLFFAVLIAFYVLYDFSNIKAFLSTHLPRIYKKETKEMLFSLRSAMSRYLLGVFLVMALVFLTQLIALSLVGLKSPLVFASFCAITDLIPYIGPYIGGVPCVLIGFSMGPPTGIATLISIFIVQLLENCFYQPYILGKTLVLPPWLILGAVLIGNSFFGLFGMLLAMPTLAILKIVFPFCMTCFKKGRAYRRMG